MVQLDQESLQRETVTTSGSPPVCDLCLQAGRSRSSSRSFSSLIKSDCKMNDRNEVTWILTKVLHTLVCGSAMIIQIH